MSLEVATKISELVPTNPVGATDFVSQGDDHLRMIKSVMQADAARLSEANTFVGTQTVTGGVTASATVQGADLVATDDLTVGDDATVGGDLAVTGTVSSGAVSTTTINAAGVVTGADLVATDDLTVGDDATVGGDLAAANVTASATVQGADLVATDDLTVGDAATVGGLLTAGNMVAGADGASDGHLELRTTNGNGIGGYIASFINGAAQWSLATYNRVLGSGTDYSVALNSVTAKIYLSINAAVRVIVNNGMQVGAAPTGGDMGVGTVNAAAGMYVAGLAVGMREMAYRALTGSGNTALTDMGNMVAYTGAGGHTFTLDSDMPAGGLVTIFNVGSAALTIAAGSLRWMNGDGTGPTGNRSLAVGGIAVGWYDGVATFYVWGNGLS